MPGNGFPGCRTLSFDVRKPWCKPVACSVQSLCLPSPGQAYWVTAASRALSPEWPGNRPSHAAAATPAFVHSMISACSSSATAPMMCSEKRLAGDPMSIGLRSERRPAPPAVSVSSSWIRWVSDHPKRSRCTTTRVSPGAMPPSSLASAGRCLSAPEPYSWTILGSRPSRAGAAWAAAANKAPHADNRRQWRPCLEAADEQLQSADRDRFTRVQRANRLSGSRSYPCCGGRAGRAAQSAQEALKRVAERMLAKQRAAYHMV